MSLHSAGSAGPWAGEGAPCLPPPLGEPGSSTQRWEHRTAVFTFSTKAVTSVWYSMSALEVSLFLTGQSRGEGWPACRNGVGALLEATRHLCACPGIRGDYQRAGQVPIRATCPFTWPVRDAPGQLHPEAARHGAFVALLRGSPRVQGAGLNSSEESLGDPALG